MGKVNWILAATCSVALIACSGGDKKSGHDEKEHSHDATKAAAGKDNTAAKEKGPAGEPGNIKITVKFEGTAPTMAALNRSSDPYCAKNKAMDESVVVDNGVLKDVVVKINGKVKGKWEIPMDPIKIAQHNCTYNPRVSTAMIGQAIEINNGDQTLHNVHAYKGANESNWFNKAQPPKSAALNKDATDAMIRFKCDVHPWMSAWVSAAKHPFNQIATTGTVEFKGVPSRKKAYKINTWHAVLGSQETKVVVEAGKTTEVTITYKAGNNG